MRISRLVSVATLSGVVALAAACGGGGGSTTTDNNNNNNNNNNTSLTGTTAVKISSTAVQSAAIAGNVTGSIGNLSSMANNGMAAPSVRSPLAKHSKDARMAKVHAAEQKMSQGPRRHLAAALGAARARAATRATQTMSPMTITCGVAGSYTFSGTYDDVSGAFQMDMTYTDCREDFGGGEGQVMDGTMSVSSTGAADSFTMTMTGFVTQLYSNDFSHLYAVLTDNMTMTGTFSMNAAGTAMTMGYAVSGTQIYDDLLSQYEMSYTDFTLESSYDFNTNTGTDTIGGTFAESWTEGGTAQTVSLAFTSFVTDWAETANYYEYRVSGTVAQTFTPATLCEGSGVSYTVATVTPIREDYTAGHTVAGEVTINTTLTVTFNADGTITVDDGTNAPVTHPDMQALHGECELQDFESSTTESTGTDTGGQAIAANSMLVTVAWTGGETSDMDLHMAYYAPGTTTLTEEVDYGHRTCVDSNCVAELDYDDTEGYGPEHITSSSLADGYYVFTVNSYSLDADPNATISASIDVGGTLFTFDGASIAPDATFTTADFNGTDPASWRRIADVRVSGGGTQVEVLAPDTVNFSEWGYPTGTAAINKPRAAKKK